MKSHKPAWWQPALLIPIMFGLLMLEQLFPLPGVSSKIVDLGIIVSAFAAMRIWVQANEGLIERHDMETDNSLSELQITIYDPDEKTKRNEEGARGVIHSVKPRSAIRSRREQVDIPKEDEKWSLN